MELTPTPVLENTYINRRTFAIISHPDAGKTTLTEKLLLYGNAIDLAGNVRARRNQRTTTSDWMEMERERGISITSTVLQFPYQDCVINLLDTPGHQDFSEDTFRTLTAVDSAVMVLDAAKGIEPQTRRLFEVCRKRGIPVFTFINKMDRTARPPLELLDEIENILGMQPVPMNWPIGDGPYFKGVYDRQKKGVYIYERTERNERMSPEIFMGLDSLESAGILTKTHIDQLQSEIDLLEGLGITFDQGLVLAGQQTPVFFGSALTNFGVRLFLDAFVEMAPIPQPYESDKGMVHPGDESFSGFVFKIQANMNPKHRDSIAFVRICSGHFERGMAVTHAQTGKIFHLARPYKLFASERLVIDEAYPGDVLGLPNTGDFTIGDTLCDGKVLKFSSIPRFQPEYFALLHNKDVSKQKQFLKGLRQLEVEGAMQVLYNMDAFKREPILAVVGELQFDVVQARLASEYNVITVVEPLSMSMARWVTGPEEIILNVASRSDVLLAKDSDDQYVTLFREKFYLRLTMEKFPQLQFDAKI
ncbi:MAG: peptide chain release factor 3 [Chloroflexi bacterium HGW-Chloroflexi-10]|nr:MAG: peptide chain release factor 3 [Chloroflexi bacterium HGW-Chloroflexi-10]